MREEVQMKSCKEKAAEWGISSRSVNDMCKKGKVAGAVKENGTWRIPDDAAKPADKRISLKVIFLNLWET